METACGFLKPYSILPSQYVYVNIFAFTYMVLYMCNTQIYRYLYTYIGIHILISCTIEFSGNRTELSPPISSMTAFPTIVLLTQKIFFSELLGVWNTCTSGISSWVSGKLSPFQKNKRKRGDRKEKEYDFQSDPKILAM